MIMPVSDRGLRRIAFIQQELWGGRSAIVLLALSGGMDGIRSLNLLRRLQTLFAKHRAVGRHGELRRWKRVAAGFAEEVLGCVGRIVL